MVIQLPQKHASPGIEPDGSFPCPQEPWSVSSSKSVQSTTFHLNYVGSILIFLHPHLRLPRSWVNRSRIFMRFEHASPISTVLIWSHCDEDEDDDDDDDDDTIRSSQTSRNHRKIMPEG